MSNFISITIEGEREWMQTTVNQLVRLEGDIWKLKSECADAPSKAELAQSTKKFYSHLQKMKGSSSVVVRNFVSSERLSRLRKNLNSILS